MTAENLELAKRGELQQEHRDKVTLRNKNQSQLSSCGMGQPEKTEQLQKFSISFVTHRGPEGEKSDCPSLNSSNPINSERKTPWGAYLEQFNIAA